MRAPESPFERYMSERILSFAYLVCPSVSGPKMLKKHVSPICQIQFQWKVTEHFRNRIEKIWSGRRKIALIEKNILKEKVRKHRFVVYALSYPLSKFEGNRTHSQWFLAFNSVRVKWKNWIEKTALNMSIRRAIFASGQNLKPPFLCQYLIFSNDLFFTLEISLGSLFKPKKSKLEENCQSKGILYP